MENRMLIDFFRFYQRHPKKIHFPLHDEESAELIRAMMIELSGIDLTVYCDDEDFLEYIGKMLAKEKKASATNRISYRPQAELLDTTDEIGVLLFDEGTDSKTLLALAEKKPQALVGLMRGTNTSYLPVWEAYRGFAEYVFIRYFCQNGKSEVLNWKKTENDIELSIVFPVFKVEKYLDQCIGAVTAWKAPYVEFLFVNDGSPDKSRDIILNYARKDPRIKLIDKENGGCASARQKGLETACGKYVGFIDPDDFTEPDMFRQLLGRALLGDYEVCYCGYNEYYDGDGTTKQIPDTLGGCYSMGTVDKNEIQKLLMYLRVAIWRGIYRRDMLTRCGIGFKTDLRRFDDLPFMMEVFAQTKSVVSVPQYLYYYRLDRPGQDVSCTDERLYVHFDIFSHVDEVYDRIDDQKIRDYLQVRKVMTHAFALRKLEEKYVHRYAELARADFKRNAGIVRTLLCLKRWLGGSGLRAYLSVMTGREAAYKKHLIKKEAAR